METSLHCDYSQHAVHTDEQVATSSDAVQVIPGRKTSSHKTRVAVYCRVSTKSDMQEDSLENQNEHYRETVGEDPRYELVEIYHDFGISGFKETRPGFRRMLEDGRKGRFDLIITKSITRLARNTGIVLDAVRELRNLGIGIYFELQNINTLSEGGELLMTLYAAFGQAESEANRVGTKMTIQRKIKDGVPIKQLQRILGYSRNASGEIVPDENASLVLMIYEMAAEGFTVGEITNYLNAEGITTQNGARFYRKTVMRVLQNEEYKGDFIQMKHYVDEHRRLRENRGTEDRYYYEEDHVPIVTRELWEKAQAALEVRQRPKKAPEQEQSSTVENYPYKDNVFCGKCGRRLEHVYSGGKNQWVCGGKKRFGRSFCPGVNVPDSVLRAWGLFTENRYISEERDRGKIVSYSYVTEDTWKEEHDIKSRASDLPALTEENYPYMNRIFCKYCGSRLRRIALSGGNVWWVCNTMSRKGKKACRGIRVPDEKLQALRNTNKVVYIGKEIINGKECYGYTGKPDR